MVEARLSDTLLAFRLKRAEQFARQWRTNAKRLQSLAADPRTPGLVRQDALGEARMAVDIVSRRAGELVELALERGYGAWEADPKIAPLLVEIRAVENALSFAIETLSRK